MDTKFKENIEIAQIGSVVICENDESYYVAKNTFKTISKDIVLIELKTNQLYSTRESLSNLHIGSNIGGYKIVKIILPNKLQLIELG